MNATENCWVNVKYPLQKSHNWFSAHVQYVLKPIQTSKCDTFITNAHVLLFSAGLRLPNMLQVVYLVVFYLVYHLYFNSLLIRVCLIRTEDEWTMNVVVTIYGCLIFRKGRQLKSYPSVCKVLYNKNVMGLLAPFVII